jgi:hypothetical protein
MHGNRDGWKYAVSRGGLAILAGVAVGAGDWFLLGTYFPDISPLWATAIGAVVTVSIAPLPLSRRVAKGSSRSVDRLTFNGAIIETGTDSYRLAHTIAKQTAG